MAQLREFGEQLREFGEQDEALLRGDGGGGGGSNKRARAGLCGVLRERRVVELARGKRRLVEVPHTATLAHAANALLAGRVSAVTVAAPPGHWIGAGGSMIVESDPATGAPRKHYIGMVNMLDILIHIAEPDAAAADDADADPAGGGEVDLDLDRKMAVPVSSVIGHSMESLTLWTLHPSTSLLDCMETFSKGVHRALVPLESSSENVVAAELVESAPAYRMLTQMDVVRFVLAHGGVGGVLSRTVRELGAVSEAVLAVASHGRVVDIIRAMRAASLTAVPVVEDGDGGGGAADAQILLDGRGKKVVETFSATDLRDCPVAQARAWLGVTMTEFKKNVAEHRREGGRPAIDATAGAQATGDDASAEEKPPPRRRQEKQQVVVTCSPESTLGEAMEKAAASHVHRVWVVDVAAEGPPLLRGVVSLTDVLRVVREAALGEDQELHGVAVSS